MNINTSYSYNRNQVKSPVAFGSAFDAAAAGLRFLNVNDAIGATLVDFSFMAMPRTIVDSKRGIDAGVETGIRENSGTLNHVLIGTIGGMAALALSGRFNKQYDVYSHSIFANNETIDILSKIWQKHYPTLGANSKEIQKAFYSETFKGLLGLNSIDGQTARWVKINPQTVSKLTETYVEMSHNPKLKGKRLPKEKIEYLKNLIVSSTGSEKDFKLVAEGKTVTFPITSFLDDLFAMGRAFSTQKVSKVFKNAQGDISKNDFVSNLKKLKTKSAILALGISCAIGASVQPLNRWFTKKRTGHDGFVGVANNPNVENKKPERSLGFLAAKATAAAGMLALALTSISTNFKEIPDKIQFKGKIPTLNQYKLVYGFTVASRFLAARSGDELRESCFKDVLGFVNWLILGGFVAKGIVTLLDGKNLLNSKSESAQGGLMNWLKNKSIKTVDEVLQNDLMKNSQSTVTNDGKAIPFKELLQKARDLKMDSTLKKIRILNIAQLGGYIYSGLVLGILIPKLNIYMTTKFNQKRQSSKVEVTPIFNDAIKKQQEEKESAEANKAASIAHVNAVGIKNKGPFAGFIN